jgi:ABC-type transport system involved in multi-copper enzyme maturation permease subunit
MEARRKLFALPRLDWPLLGKELLEQSARKQMYVIRVTYALVLFGAFWIYYRRHVAAGPVLVLGGGMQPFQFLVTAQMLTIYLFLPPLMAGAIAQEKERDTLGLLFLTDLTPWEFILQKYVGRLIPMMTLLFLSLPLLAVAYSLGGVSAPMLYASATSLFLTCLWVGALALECSAHEASTFQALLRCWGICLVIGTCCFIGPAPMGTMFSPNYPPASSGAYGGGPGSNFMFFFLPTVMGLFYLLVTLCFLARAKQVLAARAFVDRRNPFAHQFKQLDHYWKDLRKLSRAILRKRDPEAAALADQVVQRGLGELGDKRAWSPMGFLFARMQVPGLLSFAIISGFIVLIILMGNVMMDPKSGGAFSFVIYALWILALVTVPIQSANSVASERMNERMGAILTTPLTAREILKEWQAPVRRWIQFLTRPLVVVMASGALVKFLAHDRSTPGWTNLALYLGLSLTTILIYPELVRWSCLWIGLRVQNQVRALMTALMVVVAWCVVPLVSAGYLVDTGLLSPTWLEPVRMISPVAVIRTAEAVASNVDAQAELPELVVMACINLGVVAALSWVIRRLCLSKGDYYLGRV